MFPAYVGMSPFGQCSRFQVLRVPRIRGDEPGFIYGHNDPVGVFPAYVGMSPTTLFLHDALSGVPRIRGDEPITGLKPVDTSKCSPHTWG